MSRGNALPKLDLWESRKGETFGYLTVRGRCGRGMVLCVCICGAEKPISYSSLRNGSHKSCGCKSTEMKTAARTTHGLTTNAIGRLWMAKRYSARQRGLEFTIKPSDIVIPKVCPVFGIPLQVSKGKATDNSPSIDRRNNAHGYTLENIRVISWRANRLKHTMNLQEIWALAAYMEGRL